MSQYNPNKHHRRSIRLQGYDYSQAGLYFITICCEDRICRFGQVENGTMVLNEYGQIAYDEWMKTPEIRPNVKLHEFVVMPNHIHGIIQLLDIGRANCIRPMITNCIRPMIVGAFAKRPYGVRHKQLGQLSVDINHRLQNK